MSNASGVPQGAAFATASFSTVRRIVGTQLRRIPRAASQFWCAMLLLSAGALANVLVPQRQKQKLGQPNPQTKGHHRAPRSKTIGHDLR